MFISHQHKILVQSRFFSSSIGFWTCIKIVHLITCLQVNQHSTHIGSKTSFNCLLDKCSQKMHEKAYHKYPVPSGQYCRKSGRGQRQCSASRGKKYYRNSKYFRARGRMDGHDFYGSQIHVDYVAPGRYNVEDSCNRNYYPGTYSYVWIFVSNL